MRPQRRLVTLHHDVEPQLVDMGLLLTQQKWEVSDSRIRLGFVYRKRLTSGGRDDEKAKTLYETTSREVDPLAQYNLRACCITTALAARLVVSSDASKHCYHQAAEHSFAPAQGLLT